MLPFLAFLSFLTFLLNMAVVTVALVVGTGLTCLPTVAGNLESLINRRVSQYLVGHTVVGEVSAVNEGGAALNGGEPEAAGSSGRTKTTVSVQEGELMEDAKTVDGKRRFSNLVNTRSQKRKLEYQCSHLVL